MARTIPCRSRRASIAARYDCYRTDRRAGADPIRYTLRFPAPHTHYVEVEATYPTGGRPQIELFMAVWTPGSYLVREYERHVENVIAQGPDGGAADRSRNAQEPLAG